VNRFLVSAVVVAALANCGCWPKTNKRPLPVPPLPAPAAQQAPAPAPEQPASQKPPDLPPVAVPPPEEPQLKPPAPKRRTPKPQQQAPAAAPDQAPAPAANEAAPQLGVMLTAQQRQEYEKSYSTGMARAQHALILAAEYRLTDVQSESVERIRSFMKLAENSHGRDLATAAQLAQRAGLLGDDLLKTLR